MTLPRYAAKRDANEAEIVAALRKVGAFVTRLSGNGQPDLLVLFQNRQYVFEIKGKRGKRTQAQEVSQWPIVRSIEDALRMIGVVR